MTPAGAAAVDLQDAAAGAAVVRRPTPQELLGAALAYAALGWAVVPLHTPRGPDACSCGWRRRDPGEKHSIGKHPRTEHGLLDATTDPDIIREWWTKHWPTANIGILTGAGSGIIAVDIDPRHGGDETWEAVLAEHGPIPDTVEALTGGGGRHILFRHPGGRVAGGTGKLGPGIDLKADGGYLVVEPSLHESGRRYMWEASSRPGEVPLADAPDWLLARLLREERPRAEAAASGPIPEGRRNDTLTRMGGALRRQGLDEAGIRAALEAVNRERCVPPLPDAEVARIASSVARYPAGAGGDDTPWADLGPLPPEQPEAPALPPEIVPDPLRGWLTDVAERACIPLEYVAAPALVGLGALIGRQVGIRPSRYDDWLVIPNLWGGIIGRPGVMKSHAVAEALRPLQRLAARAMDAHREAAAAWQLQRLADEAALDAIKKRLQQAARAGNPTDDILAEIRDLRERAQEEPTPRRYIVQDPTTEKLAELLAQNPRGLLLVRDELAGWLATLERPGREGDREFYLESWNGSNSYTVDRVGRGTLHIPALCLSIVGGIQPGKLGAYIAEAVGGGAGADGLLQRLQVLVWPDRIGEWRQPDRWPDTEARRRAYEAIERLDAIDLDAIGAVYGEGDAVPYLRFSPAAQAVMDQWRDDLERRLRSDELAAMPAYEAHLSKYRSLMPSLALISHLLDPRPGGVSEDAALLGAAWCGYLEGHARKVYADETAPDQAAAHRLGRKIEEGAIRDGATVNWICECDWSGLTDRARVRRGLAALEVIGWVRVVREETGGRPREIVRLHPRLREED